MAVPPELAPDAVTCLPVLPAPETIVCAGPNDAEQSAGSGLRQPGDPALLPRLASSLAGHRGPIIRPAASDTLGLEGEVAAIIGRGGRHIPVGAALGHVAGHALSGDASVRELRFRGGTQRRTGNGTPGGVGHARPPRPCRHAGDVCEVEGVGVLASPTADEAPD